MPMYLRRFSHTPAGPSAYGQYRFNEEKVNRTQVLSGGMRMIRPGFETTDPFTQTRIILLKGPEETSGRGRVTEVHCPEGAPASIPAHLHQTWTETFEILRGSATCRLGVEIRNLESGENIVMPARIVHVHPWNTGSGIMVYRHTNDFGASTQEAVHDVLGAFATINGLARQGQIGKKGMPKNPLQFAATVRTLTKHGAFDAAVPISLQRLLSATLGRLAESLGYKSVYDQYLDQKLICPRRS